MRLRKKTPRRAPVSEPDLKLYDMWGDPAPRPGAETIAVIRARNQALNVYPADPADFDQSWELVFVDPRADDKQDRVIYTSRTELKCPHWSRDGEQILAQVGQRDVLVWNGTNCRVYKLAFPATEPEMPRLLLACFGGDNDTVDLIMDSYLRSPYLLGSAKLGTDPLQVDPLFRFKPFDVPAAMRHTEPMERLFGRASGASVQRPPFHVTPDRRFSFFYRKKEGFLPRGWIEGRDAQTGAAFEVSTLWRGLYAE